MFERELPMKKTIQLSTEQKKGSQPEAKPKTHKQPEKILPVDIHKVVDGQVVPTRAPSEVERDISPGIPTQE